MTDHVFRHLRPEGSSGERPVVIVADHASNRIPEDLEQLGLSQEALEQHIAYDIGTAALAEAVSVQIGAHAILSTVSRLVIDKNRRLDQPGLVPEASDGIAIPGNRNLSESDLTARIDRFHHRYHNHIAATVGQLEAPVLLSLHSFTPHMNGTARPWHCGLLYNQDQRLARRAIAHFEAQDLIVGDNQPYPGSIYNATMDRHAEAHCHPYVMLEIRNDLLQTPEHIHVWAARIKALMSAIVQ